MSVFLCWLVLFSWHRISLNSDIRVSFIVACKGNRRVHFIHATCRSAISWEVPVLNQCASDKKMLIFSYISLVSLCLFNMTVTMRYCRYRLYKHSQLFSFLPELMLVSNEFLIWIALVRIFLQIAICRFWYSIPEQILKCYLVFLCMYHLFWIDFPNAIRKKQGCKVT